MRRGGHFRAALLEILPEKLVPTMASSTHVTLLERLRNGTDPLAWNDFYQRYWRLLHHFARQRGCSQHTAEDVVQEVMLKVFEQLEVFRYDPARGRFRNWLFTVVRNAIAERRRRPDDRVHGQGGDTGNMPPERMLDEDRPDELWEAAFEEAMLVVLLEVVRREVPARVYQAFELISVHGFPAGKTADIVGLSRHAAYRARDRVLQRLKELGAPYRDRGQLHQRLKQAMQSQPSPAEVRSMVTRMETTPAASRRCGRE
jgi:RNA polymerase sigma-70 factor (ECF subfamily)